MEIDVVYTWVDGSDESWKRKKQEYSQKGNGKISADDQSDARFMNNEELKYSIRSLFTYASWINKIYIITDNQIPNWLNENFPKIRIIDHKEIFQNHDLLPTFSSRAIEANLHHIPGLSEYFIYFNDDMFIGDFCAPEHFFLNNGHPRIFVSDLFTIKRKKHLNSDFLKNNKNSEHQNAVINSRRLLKETFNKSFHNDIRHWAKAYRKSVFIYLEKILKKKLLITMSHRFRDNSDILLCHLACMYSLLSGVGKQTYVPSLSLKLLLYNDLIKKIKRFSFCYVHLSSEDMDLSLSLIEKYNPIMFCLNQYHDSPDSNLAKIQPFLEKYYPNPSPAEKGLIRKT